MLISETSDIGLQDPSAAAAAMHHHHHHHHHAAAAAAHHHYGHHHHGHHHGYKVPRVYFKIPRVLPYKEQREKFEADDFFKKLAREAEVRKKDAVSRRLLVSQ